MVGVSGRLTGSASPLLGGLGTQNYFSTVLAVARAEKFETAVSGQALGPSELGLYSKYGSARDSQRHATLGRH